uniref:helix-turn-helix domain-containing protein n=1 Tax=Sulfuriferula sp. GW6 TaxID=3345112 RepID=UPI0039F6A356
MQIEIASTAEFGSVVKKVRKSCGIIQRETAFLAGVSPPFLNKLERGGIAVHLGKVIQVCQSLGIKIILELPENFEGESNG